MSEPVTEETFNLPFEIRRSRFHDLGWALLCLAIVAAAIWILPQMTEQDLMETRVRRGGWLKGIIAAIGFEWFVLGTILGAAALAILGIGFLWRASGTRPDVKVTSEGFSFHPARYGKFVGWSDIDRWKIATDGDLKYLKVYARSWYWRPLGIYPRKSIAIRHEVDGLSKVVTVLELANVPFDETH